LTSNPWLLIEFTTGDIFCIACDASRIVPVLISSSTTFATDRNDLDNQLFEEFSRSHELIRQYPVQADSRKQLQELLKVVSGGVIFTTIQKFAPEKNEKYPILSERRNIVVIADEAHRSQYEFIHLASGRKSLKAKE
jgi:type I restriction enzyme, R subunit